VTFNGRNLQELRPDELVAMGIALVPEGRGIFAPLTVRENLRLGAWTRRDRPRVAEDYEHVLTLFPRLRERLTQIAGTLSGGEQQMLAVGRALMSRAKLMLLDEPSMGLAPRLLQEIFSG
jgi:branched-chain amino acid transport system ATP-binding protein